MDSRERSLQQWVVKQLNISPENLRDDSDVVWSTVSGDASFRRYFRIQLPDVSAESNKSYIAVDAPADKEDSRPFVEIAKALSAVGVQVPRVIEADLTQGYMLLSDLGDTLMLGHIESQQKEGLPLDPLVDAAYLQALEELCRIQQCKTVPGWPLPKYSNDLLHTEMSLFSEWFLVRYLELSPSNKEKALLNHWFQDLASLAVNQPQTFVHRDYHSRNLMCLADGGIGVIDFQDAVKGPVTYDLVSILKDCYIKWPRATVVQWVSAYQQKAEAAEVFSAVESQEFLTWFDAMGLQRHIKVAGIFSRLNFRDGKAAYLSDIPRTMSYIMDAFDCMPAYGERWAGIRGYLAEAVVPALIEKNSLAAGWFMDSEVIK